MAALGASATAALSGCGATSGETEPAVDEGTVTMYNSLGCGCCDEYADHLSSIDGVGGSTSETNDRSGVKSRFGVPSDLESCHTIDAGEYAIGGHVPVEAIEQLATERPDAQAIALPKMPSGAPEMGVRRSGHSPSTASTRTANRRCVCRFE